MYLNSALKGAFADLSRGFVRVFGQAKLSGLLGFTLAAYNLDRVRSFRAKTKPGLFGVPSVAREHGTTSSRGPDPVATSATRPPG
jgi:hypothetical protein